MKLFKMSKTHYAKKGNETGVEGYFMCENEGVFYDEYYKDFADTENLLSVKLAGEIGRDLGDLAILEAIRQAVIDEKGIEDESFELNFREDVLCGGTSSSWEIIAEDVNVNDFKKAIELEIIKIIETE